MKPDILATSWTLLAFAAPLHAQQATFDAQSEGGIGPSYSENGLVFSDLDRYLGSSFEWFVIEDASGTLAGMPGFSSPNTLGFGGWSPGPGVGFSRCGSFNLTPPALASDAELNFFVAGGSSAGNRITLEARLAGVVVDTDSVVVPSAFGPHHLVLAISGNDFDQLRVVGTGSANSGSFFAVLDDVSITGDDLGSNYCTSTPNSTGGAAIITATGSASIAANDLVLHAAPVPNQPGLFYYGPNQTSLAFGNGTRCVGGTVGRFAVTNAVAGSLDHAVDYANPPSAPLQITAGSTWNFQAWFRDPAGGGSSFDLSDGLEISFVP